VKGNSAGEGGDGGGGGVEEASCVGHCCVVCCGVRVQGPQRIQESLERPAPPPCLPSPPSLAFAHSLPCPHCVARAQHIRPRVSLKMTRRCGPSLSRSRSCAHSLPGGRRGGRGAGKGAGEDAWWRRPLPLPISHPTHRPDPPPPPPPPPAHALRLRDGEVGLAREVAEAEDLARDAEDDGVGGEGGARGAEVVALRLPVGERRAALGEGTRRGPDGVVADDGLARARAGLASAVVAVLDEPEVVAKVAVLEAGELADDAEALGPEQVQVEVMEVGVASEVA
jgi:hypothetical protein